MQKLDVGESGSTLRFLLPVLGALGVRAEIRMHGRLPERPLSPLWEVLEAHGMRLQQDGAVLHTDWAIMRGETIPCPAMFPRSLFPGFYLRCRFWAKTAR